MTRPWKVNNNLQPLVSRSLAVARSRTIAWGTLGFSILLTFFAWQWTVRQIDNRHQDRFDFRMSEIIGRVEDRMLQYELVLRGGVGLYEASKEVSREEWKNYVNACQVQTHFPGIQAMAVSVVIDKDQKDAHEAKIRSEGFGDYHIRPTSLRDDYTAIIYLEPFDWRNQRALGYDMYSEPARHKAMDRAVETGLASISAKITLVQETDVDVQSGILCYLPIYKKGMPLNNSTARRDAIEGWVYGAFRMDDLMDGIVGDDISDVNFQVFDSRSVSESSRLYDSEKKSTPVPIVNEFTASRQVEVSGRDWTIQLSAKPEFFKTQESAIGWVVAISGLLFNGLLFAVILSIRMQRGIAVQLAEKMTQGLKESETRTRLILENASEAILSVSRTGDITAANSAAHTVFESGNSLLGSSFSELLPELSLQDAFDQSTNGSTSENGIAAVCHRNDGRPFSGRVSVGCLEVHGEKNYIVIVRDETARIEAEFERAEANKRLVWASHEAGKAEVATGVLHNVGNVLNSVNVSANLIKERIDLSPVGHLSRASDVIQSHAVDLGSFFTNDNRGVHFPEFLEQLASSFRLEQERQLVEVDELVMNIEHIKAIVSMQQSFAKNIAVTEIVDPIELVEDAIKLIDPSICRDQIQLTRDYGVVPSFQAEKHQAIQILINLIKNAKQALDAIEGRGKEISVTTRLEGGFVLFIVKDTGIGICSEQLDKIFQHGFTTKVSGHGFGLHSCANAARAIGGELTVFSRGVGTGATFTLRLPATESPACLVQS